MELWVPALQVQQLRHRFINACRSPVDVGAGAGRPRKKGLGEMPFAGATGLATSAAVVAMLLMYASHSYWLISSAYSSPNIFLTSKKADGS